MFRKGVIASHGKLLLVRILVKSYNSYIWQSDSFRVDVFLSSSQPLLFPKRISSSLEKITFPKEFYKYSNTRMKRLDGMGS
jgi:hypothetical protein